MRKDENGVFVSPWKVNMAGNKLSGLSFPSKSDEAATKEYADKVGNEIGNDYKQFLLFSQCFQHLYIFSASNASLCGNGLRYLLQT